MPNEEISDEELLLRKRARRRLIGAFVVVIAMVLILPAVLEDKPQPVSQNVEIVLPPPVASSPNPPIAATGPSIPAQVPATPAPTIDDKPKTVEPKETPKPADKESLPAPTEPAKRPAPLAEPTDTKPKPTAKPGGERFHVQVGVFSNAENVKQLQAKLSAQGVKARSETLADGKIRVRAGPFTTRQEAERTGEKIRAAGLSAVVVKVAAKP